jgi:hypothetical protein
VWNAVTNAMQWDKFKNSDSLIEEIKKGIHHVPKNDLLHSVNSWSRRILSILKTKGAYIK